jgi:predicted DNA-binding transcriptional regulator AlpA
MTDPMNTPLAQLLSDSDLADRWKVSKRTIQRWRADNRLPQPFKVGRKALYPLDVISAFEMVRPASGEP